MPMSWLLDNDVHFHIGAKIDGDDLRPHADPVDLLPCDAILEFQVAFAEYRQRRLKGMQADPAADEVLRAPNTGIGVDIHLPDTEEPARKYGYADQRQVGVAGHRHDERGQRHLGNVEGKFREHAFVPIGAVAIDRAFAHFERLERDALRRTDRPIEERDVPVVAIDRDCELHPSPLIPIR